MGCKTCMMCMGCQEGVCTRSFEGHAREVKRAREGHAREVKRGVDRSRGTLERKRPSCRPLAAPLLPPSTCQPLSCCCPLPLLLPPLLPPLVAPSVLCSAPWSAHALAALCSVASHGLMLQVLCLSTLGDLLFTGSAGTAPPFHLCALLPPLGAACLCAHSACPSAVLLAAACHAPHLAPARICDHKGGAYTEGTSPPMAAMHPP